DEYCSKEKLKLDQIDKQNKLFDDKIEECQRILREIDNYEKYIKYANASQGADLTRVFDKYVYENINGSFEIIPA
ncbi:MAG: hypothetical protein O7C59_11775, partial [Rickettsia endosymbiont of Ixodes persulcatus]|nr:hypothetical protein [Rickettsia endosymbiont of Ixodes persulcatus]